MGYAVSLWFDAAAEARVRALWRELAKTGAETFADGPIRPHVTLAHGLNLEPEPLVAALGGRLEAQSAFDLTFTGLGLFAESGVLYLSTRMTEPLWTLHRAIAGLAAAHGARSSPHYRPDHWTPHCTLAINLSPEAMLNAVAACQGVPFPFSATATRVGVIENPSERELAVLPLAARP